MTKFPYLLTWNSKYGPVSIVAKNQDEMQDAYVAMFHLIENDLGPRHLDGDEPEFYARAMDGDWKAAKWFLEIRSSHEYEYVEGQCLSSPHRLLEQNGIHRCQKCNRYKPNTRAVSGCVVRGILPFHICKSCDPREIKRA